MVRALGLLSGGLDSTLAAKLLIDQGIEVHAVNFTSPFCTCTPKSAGCASVLTAVKQLGDIPLKRIVLGDEYLDMVKSPKFGYGRGMNPCIDCRIMKIRKAADYMREIGASFLFTGEVLGQRPMSQHRHAIDIIDRESGMAGLTLRPLSARLFPPTIPEQNGWVDRSRLLAINGRSRKSQIALASQKGILDYRCPAGGCLLTEPHFADRLKDYFDHCEKPSCADIPLLKIGRHFRMADRGEIIVARDAAEGEKMVGLRRPGGTVLVPIGFSAPVVLFTGMNKATAVAKMAEYTNHSIPDNAEVLMVADVGTRKMYLSTERAGYPVLNKNYDSLPEKVFQERNLLCLMFHYRIGMLLLKMPNGKGRIMNNGNKESRDIVRQFILPALLVFFIQGDFILLNAQVVKDTLQEHSLGAYIRRALDRNPQLVARRHMVETDKEKIGASLALPDPIAGLSFANGQDGIEAEKLSLSQGIPWPGRLISNRKAAKASYLASEQMLKDLETDVLFKVRVAYGKMYAMGKMAVLERESLQLLKRAESAALAEYATSMQSQASVLKLQLEMAVAEDQIRQFEVEADIARDELAGLLDISSANIPNPDSLPVLQVPFSIEEARKIAMELNPEVRKAEYELVAARHNVSSALTMFVPDFMLGAEYVPQGSSLTMAGGQMGWMFMAGISLPLWPWSKSAEVRMARHMEEYWKSTLGAEKTALAAEASAFFREYYDAIRRIDLLDKNLIPKAKQTLTAVEEAYRTSRATLMDYIDSERMLLDLKMQRITQEVRREKTAGEIVICCLAKY